MNNYRDRLKKAKSPAVAAAPKPEDLNDAIEYIKDSEERHVKNPKYIGTKLMDPQEFHDISGHTQGNQPGWLKSHSPQERGKLFTEEYGDYTKHIPELHAAGQLAPAISIDGTFGDGRHRALWHHAIGEKMPVAHFSTGASKMQKSDHTYRNRLKKAKEKSGEESLEKGKRGNWEDEGYTLSHYNIPFGSGTYGKGGLVVTAHSPRGHEIGTAEIHHMDDHQLFPRDVDVAQAHKRKGVGSAMYNYAENITGKKMIPSPDQTAAAKKFWVNRNGLAKAKDKIPGGLADNKPDSEFDKDSLKVGAKDEESEHTQDADIAKELAKDHLVGNSHYYDRLKAVQDKKLAKGSAQRRAKFDPRDVDSDHKETLESWKTYGNGDSASDHYRDDPREAREDLPEMSGAARQRAITRLIGKTQNRKNPHSGEHEVLLHRGASADEIADSHSKEHNTYATEGNTSWTPVKKVAGKFKDPEWTQNFDADAMDDDIEDSRPHGGSGKMISAWVPLKQIHHVPNQYGNTSNPTDPTKVGPSDYQNEHEVIVKPSVLSVHKASRTASKMPKIKSAIRAMKRRQKDPSAPAPAKPLAKGDNGIIPVGTRPASAAPKAPKVQAQKTVKIAKFNANPLNVSGVSMSLGKSDDLEKGLNGDWQKEGYKIKPGKLITDKAGIQTYQVHAFDPKGVKIGHYEFEGYADHPVASVTDSRTHKDHQRKGLATAAYKMAEQAMKKELTPGGEDDWQTPAAKQLWAQKNRPFGLNKSEPLQKDVIDMKTRKPVGKPSKEAKVEAKRAFFEDLKNNKPSNQSTDQKIAEALRSQGKDSSDYDSRPNVGQGSGLMDQPSAQDRMNDLKIRQHEVRQKKTKADKERDAQIAYENMSPYDKMKSNFQESNPESHKFILENEAKQATEPYYGHQGMSGLQGYSDNSKHPQAFPHMNVDPKGVLGKEVADFGHDPFMWMDTKYGATKKVLQEHKDKPLDIHTRSDLIGHDDYMEHLQPGRHRIFIHSPSASKNINRIMMPGTPSLQRQLKAASKLREAGHDVTMVHDNIPGFHEAHPGLNTSTHEFAQAVKAHDPKLKVSVNDIQPSDKSKHFLENVHKIIGSNNED